MITIRLKGGIGNQMFQYAFGRALSLKYKVPLKLDTEIYKIKNHLTERSYDLHVFNVKAEIAKPEEIPFLFRNFGNGRFLYFLNELIRKLARNKIGPYAYLDGYWQSPKYFENISDVIRRDFTLKDSLPENIQNLLLEIKAVNALCLHVRRTDFVGNSAHELVGPDYYQKGVEYIGSRTTTDKIYVFSDDVAWCQENMKFAYPTVFVSAEYNGEKNVGNLFLMRACKNFIIPNSSFSWWAAWLAENPDKIVIVPRGWAGDIVPESWVRL